jgi:peptidoglycan/xylan/chitin deacetylase (PgdA/CDA1 family)
MTSKINASLMLAILVVGAWFSFDVGQSAVLGQSSLEANAALYNPCRIQPYRYYNQYEPVDYATVDGCTDPIVIDRCPNIDGVQSVIPPGYQKINGLCVPISTPDLCPNLAGVQSVVPPGYQIDGSGQCVVIPSPIDICSNIAGIQSTVPAGYQADGTGQCMPFPIDPIDLCPNIAGIQATVPPGYQIDGAGNCVLIPVVTQPTCTLSMSPAAISFGNTATLSWTTANATALSISGIGIVTPVASGSQSVTPTVTTTFTGSVNGDGGSATCSVTLTVLPDALNNGGFEQQGTSATSAYDWQGAYNNGYTRVQVPHSGSWSIRFQNGTTAETSGAYQRLEVNQTTAKPVSVTGYVKGQGIAMAPGSWIGASLYAEIYFTDGTIAYWNSIPNSGTFNWRWIGFNTGTLPTQKPISHIFIVPILGNASGTAYFDDIAVTPIEPVVKSAATIIFDDANVTDIEQAKPVMDMYGFKGTSAIPVGDLGDLGVMTSTQVQSLRASGWEIVSHGVYNDTNLTAVTPAQAAADITNSKSLLEALGFAVRNFAWPFGSFNAELIGYAQASGYTSTRTFEAGDNPQGAFPYDIKSRQVTNTTTPAQVAQWLAEGKAKNRWEVLVFHVIKSSGDDIYYTSPAVFAQMMAVVAQSGVPVMTYNQALVNFATIGGPNPASSLPGYTTPPDPIDPIDPIDPCGGRFGGYYRCVLP